MVQTLLALIPTILFVLIVLWGFLLGLARGLRKSVILLIQALVAFIIALIFYLVIVNLQSSDKMVVDIANNFMGAGGLQRLLGVSETKATLTEIITEFIVTKVNYGEGITLALQENANYLATIINLVYHLVFFFIALLVYDILLFLFYLIYVLFYPERRYRDKKQSKELDLNSEKKYNKRTLWGGLVGLLRGLTVGFIYMSFIGAILFMVGGGIGEKQYKNEYDFGDENKNRLYNVYEALGSYGNHGIIKILNVAKDKNEVPYYYFAANIVLSGKLVDEDLGINENIKFTEEIGQYTRLVRDTFDLMMEVDSQTAIALINREIEPRDDRVFALLSNQQFREGFSKLIEKFDGGKFFINFALSMIDSIASHLDQVEFTKDMDPKTKEILLVLLKSDHYSSYVPDDTIKKNNNQKVDTLKLSQLFVKEDVNKVLNVALELLGIPDGTSDSAKLKIYSDKVIPVIKGLSIFNYEDKVPQVNKVLERLFVAIDNLFKPEDTEQLTVERLELLSSSNIVWTDEIKNLLDTLSSGINLMDTVMEGESFDESNDATQLIEMMFRIFHGPKKDQTIALYNDVETKLKNSKVLDKILSISFINKAFIGALTSSFGDVYVPDTIRFADYGEDKGELSCFLGAIRSILEKEDNKDLLLSIIGGGEDISSAEGLELLSTLCDNFTEKDTSGKRTIDYLADSVIMHVLVSGLIINNRDLGGMAEIYLPDEVFVTVNGEIKNLIKEEEIKGLIQNIPNILSPVSNYLNTPDEEKNIDALIDGIKAAGNEMLNNVIIEGTISSVIKNLIEGNEYIILPNYLDNIDAWISTPEEPGEFRKILGAKTATKILINDVINNGFTEVISTILSSLNEEIDDTGITKLEKICESGIIYSTLTNALDKLLRDDLVSPNAKLASKIVYRGELQYSLDELASLVDVINVLAIDIKNVDLTEITNNLSTLAEPAEGMTETRLDIVYKSIIARSLLYVKLNDIVNNNELLVDTIEAKETIGDTDDLVTIYKKSEIESIIRLISSLGEGVTINNISLDNLVLTDEVITNIGNSYIVTATLSKALVDKDLLIILDDDYDHTYNHIKNTSLTGLLTAVKDGLNITNVNALSTDSIKLPQGDRIDALLASDIMRATISSKISAGDDVDIYVAASDSVFKHTYENNEVLVVTSEELKAFITGVNELSPDGNYNVTLNDDTLKNLRNKGHVNVALNSSILYVAISNYVMANADSAFLAGADKEYMSVYDINTMIGESKEVFTKSSIELFVTLLG